MSVGYVMRDVRSSLGAVLFGWLLLLDLSANGNPGNRYLALYHHGHLWLAMLVLTVVTFLRPGVGRALAWLLSAMEELGGRVGRLLGPLLAPAAEGDRRHKRSR